MKTEKLLSGREFFVIFILDFNLFIINRLFSLFSLLTTQNETSCLYGAHFCFKYFFDILRDAGECQSSTWFEIA